MENPSGLDYSHIVMGLFALYVVIVSLLRIMAEKEFFRLTAMKRIWGRTVGLLMHFLANVALPLVCGVIFLSSGIAGLGVSHEMRRHDPVLHKFIQRHTVEKAAENAPQTKEQLTGNYSVDLDPFFKIAP